MISGRPPTSVSNVLAINSANLLAPRSRMHAARKHARPKPLLAPSPPQAQLLHPRPVPLAVLALQVVEQAPPLPDHLVKSAPGVVVLLVHPQVLGQLVDAGGQNGHLHLRRTGVALMLLKVGDDALLGF